MNVSPVVVIGLVVIAGLILLYLVAQKRKQFGKSLGFVCAVLGRMLVKISEYMGKAADYCYKACIASLRYPPGVSSIDYWHGVLVIARLVIFLLAGTVLSAEPVNTILVLPALYQTASTIHFPGIVELTSAALFIAAPALWWCALFEVWGLIPHGCGMFPRLGTLTRWVLGIVSGVFLILAILVTGYLYIFRAVYLLSPDSTQGMSLYILGGLGLLTAGSAVLAFWAFVVGVLGVVSLVTWVCELIARTSSAIASLPCHQLDTIALHLTNGEIGVWGEQIERDPHKYPSFPATSPSQTVTVSLPERASTIVDSELEKIEPVKTTELEIPLMTNPDKNAAFVPIGNFGTKMLNPLSQKIDSLHATDNILTGMYLDMSVPYKPLGIPGVTDLSPTHVERFASMLHGDELDEVYKTLLTNASDRIVQAHLQTKINPSPLIACIDCHQLASSSGMFRANKRRLPLLKQWVITSVSPHDAKEPIVQAGLASHHVLHTEGDIENVLVVDSKQSPFAAQYGEETLLQWLAQFIVSLTIAHKHSVHNDALPRLLEDVHTVSPFYTVSFASEAVAVGKVPSRWGFIPGLKGKAGSGVYGDILSQCRAIKDRVLTEEETRAFPAEVHSELPFKLLYNVPIALNDTRFALCVRDNALFVGTQYPNASSLTVRGNGCAYPYHLGGRFLVGVTALYPLQPATFLKVREVRNIKITPLYPEQDLIDTLNGNTSRTSVEPVNKTPRKKAVTTSRTSKAITARRNSRKNTKQAKQAQ